MDNSSGVGVLDKAAIVLGALEAGPRPWPSSSAPPGWPVRRRIASPSPSSTTASWRVTCRVVSSSVPVSPSLPQPPARTASSPPPVRPGRPARPHPRERPALPPPGRPAHLRGGSRAPDGSARLDPGRCQPVHARRFRGSGPARLGGARPDAPWAPGREVQPHHLVRRPRRGWAQSVSEREFGVASVSAPVRGPSGRVVAAVSISGRDRAGLPSARSPARGDRGRRRQQAHRDPAAGPAAANLTPDMRKTPALCTGR